MEMSWIQVLVLAFGNLAWMLPIFFWLRSESRADYRATLAMIDSIQKEMKDFHGRLERQDAEFKSFMRHQEEKRTTILMRDK